MDFSESLFPQHRTFAVYVHWPWCKAKCPYCDFNSHASEIHEDAYVDGLLKELSLWNEGRTIGGFKTPPFNATSRQVGSLFFGGGTPSLMSAEHVAKVIQACRTLGRFDEDTEVTIECNPTSFSELRHAREYLIQLKDAGVNRVSIGIQGLKQEWLSFLGRSHSVEEALGTLRHALDIFDNVNADVIYGLPDQSLDEWRNQLINLAEMGLSHISAYQLTIEANTRFYKDVKRGLWTPIHSDLEADFFDETRRVLGSMGYENYEISNFAKPGKACRHNSHVWRYGEYLGIGAGAHGRVVVTDGTPVATHVVRQPDGYLRRISDGADTLSGANPLSLPEAVQEAIFSGLRLSIGVDMEYLEKRFGEASCKEAVSYSEIDVLTLAGLLERTPQHLRLTDKGWPLLNSVLERILLPISSSPQGTHASSSPTDSEYKKPITVTIL